MKDICKLDLPQYLRIKNYRSFHDIFHKDESPSASMFISNNGNNNWLYKCFSSSYPFIGTIIEVTMKLQNMSKAEAVDFLCEIYNISVEDKQRELKTLD